MARALLTFAVCLFAVWAVALLFFIPSIRSKHTKRNADSNRIGSGGRRHRHEEVKRLTLQELEAKLHAARDNAAVQLEGADQGPSERRGAKRRARLQAKDLLSDGDPRLSAHRQKKRMVRGQEQHGAEKVAAAAAATANNSSGMVAIRTSQGDLRVRLRPDWHAPSVSAVSSLAGAPASCTRCELYRVEHGFLVQGILKGRLPVNTETGCRPAPACQPGPRVMQRGDIGWAGGGAGPDFFVYLGERPAGWLKRDHTVWGEIADEESLRLADKIVSLPSHTPGGPNTMRFLKERLHLEVVPVAS